MSKSAPPSPKLPTRNNHLAAITKFHIDAADRWARQQREWSNALSDALCDFDPGAEARISHSGQRERHAAAMWAYHLRRAALLNDTPPSRRQSIP